MGLGWKGVGPLSMGVRAIRGGQEGRPIRGNIEPRLNLDGAGAGRKAELILSGRRARLVSTG